MIFHVPGQLLLVESLLFAAFVLAAWTTLTGWGAGGLPGCSAGSGCKEITSGRWSRFGPIPISLLGAGIYAALLAMVAGRMLGDKFIDTERSTPAIAAMCWTCCGAAVWFTFLQAAVIRRWCAYCLLTHGFAVAAAVWLLVADGVHDVPVSPVIAIFSVASLIAGQILWEPKRYHLEAIAKAPSESLPSEPTSVPATHSVEPIAAPLGSFPRKHRLVSLASGRVQFDCFDFPLLGSPDATHMIAAFIDFTCKECSHLHRLIHKAIAEYPGQLAVSLIPVPLHEGCNPNVKCHRQEQAYACRFARLAWAIWFANPDAFVTWDHFLVGAAGEVQPYGTALLRAGELVNLSPFKADEAEPHTEAKIAESIRLFEKAGKPIVPALILSEGILKGHVTDLPQLVKLLSPYAPLTPPENQPIALASG